MKSLSLDFVSHSIGVMNGEYLFEGELQGYLEAFQNVFLALRSSGLGVKCIIHITVIRDLGKLYYVYIYIYNFEKHSLLRLANKNKYRARWCLSPSFGNQPGHHCHLEK